MRLAGLSARVLPALFVAGLGGLVLAEGGASVRLVGVSASVDANDHAVLIEASEPVAYSVSRPDPLTVLVELRNVSVAGAQTRVPPTSVVRAVEFEDAIALDGNPVGRVRLALVRPARHQVRSERNTIRLDFDASAAPAPAAPAPRVAREATALTGVRASTAGGRTTITLMGNGPLSPGPVREAEDLPARVVLDFPGLTFTAPAQTRVGDGAVRRVRVAMNQRVPPITRVVIDLAEKMPFHVERVGGDLAVILDAPQSRPAVAPAPASSAPPASPAQAAAVAPVAAAVAGSQEAGRDAETGELIPIFSDLTRTAPTGAINPMKALELASATVPSKPQASQASQTPQAPAPQAPAPPTRSQPKQTPPPPPAPAPVPSTKPDTGALTGTQRSEAQKQYTGNPVSLDFQNADLRSVLRTFAEISGLNMVIDPNVQGSVDIVLTDVPWDQALDTILRANNLGYMVDGTIVRIATLTTLQAEQDQRKKLQQSQTDAGQLIVRTFTLSYAKAADVSALLVKSALSTRGQIQVDTRTNTLILTDLPERLDTAANLLAILDRAEPQVEVEARVVQTTREFARAMGVQWGFGGRMTPELGNTLPFEFPNKVIVGGRSGQQGPTDYRSQAGDQVPTLANLGVTGEGVTTVGVQLGAVNGSFNLDVALSALERSGKGRVLSTPRLTTQNNIEAEVAQGVQIPIQTVANNTVTVSFKDAVLMLKVTPQITSANTVIMKITIENASPDFSRSVNNIPPIDTQRANTQVQVNDGATTVIGGIFVSQEQSANQRVPLLHRIPLLGWLFRKDTVSDQSRELLIFITPRILRG
jgi:type IV pilus assembly protein PilQ